MAEPDEPWWPNLVSPDEPFVSPRFSPNLSERLAGRLHDRQIRPVHGAQLLRDRDVCGERFRAAGCRDGLGLRLDPMHPQ